MPNGLSLLLIEEFQEWSGSVANAYGYFQMKYRAKLAMRLRESECSGSRESPEGGRGIMKAAITAEAGNGGSGESRQE